MYRLFLRNVLAVFLMLVALGYSEAQEKKAYKVSCIGFYNLENLFDTLPGPNDVEFTPDGPNKWNSERYYHKLNNMAEVIAQIGDEMFPGGPAVNNNMNGFAIKQAANNQLIPGSEFRVVWNVQPDRSVGGNLEKLGAV